MSKVIQIKSLLFIAHAGRLCTLDDFEQGQFSSLKDFIAEQNQKYGLSLEA